MIEQPKTREKEVCLICGRSDFRFLGHHLKRDDHDFMSLETYAKTFKTKDWIRCILCGTEYFGHERSNRIRRCPNKACMLILKQEEMEKTNNAKFGCKNVFQNKQIQKVIANTLEEHFGVRHPSRLPQTVRNSHSPEAEAKRSETARINDSWAKAVIKRHETMKRESTIGKKISKAEQSFFEQKLMKMLLVYRQVHIRSSQTRKIFRNTFDDHNDSFTFDFLVLHEKNPIVVAFDGLYYHGLDCSIHETAKKPMWKVDDHGVTKKTQASVIFNTYYRDRTFEEYCQKRNITLIRFAETDFDNPYFTCGDSSIIDSFLRIIQRKKS